MTMIVVTIKLPKDTDAHFRKAAKHRGISKGAVIREKLMEQVRQEKEREQKQPIAA